MKTKFIKALYFTYQNAKDLFEEATILKDNEKYGRSYTLYHLSFEESGRFQLLNNILIEHAKGKIKTNKLNYGTLKKRGFENHNRKISESFKGMYITSLLSVYSKVGINSVEEFYKEKKSIINELTTNLQELLKHEVELNRLKNVGLYVTYSNNDFHSPNDAISAAQFFRIQNLAKVSLNSSKMIIDFIEYKGGFEKLKEILESK